MNRQLKFRAWDEGNHTMHNNFQFIKSGDEGNDWIIFISDRQPLDVTVGIPPLENPYFQQQLKIMQFTGLLDKNGKEIYEGDVVRIHTGWGGDCLYPTVDAEIRFDAPEYYAHNMGENDGLVMQDFNWNEIEVIGNIYEHPELLKQDNT